MIPSRKTYTGFISFYRQTIFALFLLLTGSSLAFGQQVTYSIDSLEARNLYERGEQLLNEARYDSSITLLSRAAEYYEKAGNRTDLARSYNLLSTNYRILSRLDESERLAGKVLDLLQDESADLPMQKIRALNNFGLIETERSNFKEAIAYFEDALEIAEQPDVPDHTKAMLLGNLGSAYDDRGDYEEALELYSRGAGLLDIERSNEDRKQLAKLYNYSGVTRVKMGRFEEALEFYKKELEINLELFGTSHPSVAGGYNNIGGIYYRTGDIGEAIVYFKRAASSTELTFGKNHPRVGLIYNNIGACYYETGDYSQSVEYLKKSAEIKRETQGADHPDLALTYNNIGSIYTEMGRHQEAIDFLNRSLDIRLKSLGKTHPVLSNNYNSLGLLYLKTNEPDLAIENFSKGLEITEESRGPNHPFAAEARTNLAKAYKKKGDFSTALKFLEEAESRLSNHRGSGINRSEAELNTGFRYPTYAIDVLDEKGKTLYEKYHSNQSTGIEPLKLALATYTRLSELLDVMQIGFQNEESKLLMRSRSHEIYESAIKVSYDLFRATGEESYFNDIYFFSEKSKTRVILELLNNKRAKSYAGIPDSLLSFEQNLREKISGIQQSLNSGLSVSGPETDEDSLETSLFNLHQRLNDHVERLRKEYPKYHAFKYRSEVPDLSQLKKLLQTKDVSLLEFFYGSTSAWAIVVDGSDINVIPLSQRTDLTERVGSLNRAISQQKDTEYRRLAHDFYQDLIEPVEQYIQTENLLVIPDGALNLLPFEALLSSEPAENTGFRDYSYLLNTYAISYMPSVSLSTFFDEKISDSYAGTLAAFAPVFSGNEIEDLPPVANRNNWQALPSSRYEVQQIADSIEKERSLWNRLMGGSTTRLFTGNEATESRFKSGPSKNYRYLHLATHAFASDTSAGRAGIVLHPETDVSKDEDGILYSEEIYGMNLKNELVVLSACETGTGEIRTGEGIIGLSRAFQYAGAEKLLVSLWSVEDRSTAQLMISFYEQLQNGKGTADALQTAKRGLIETSPYAHPRYWSPFIFIGNQN